MEPVERFRESDAARVVVVDEYTGFIVEPRRRRLLAQTGPSPASLHARLALPVVAESHAQIVAVAHEEQRRELAERVAERDHAVAALLAAEGQAGERLARDGQPVGGR